MVGPKATTMGHHAFFRRAGATTFELADIVHLVKEGRVRLPDFQRSFVWDWDDVRLLVDSIVHRYPVGCLLLWERPAKAQRFRLGAIEIDAPQFDQALWVVDGQQRITSLVNALCDEGFGDSRFSIAYDLTRRSFIKGMSDEPNVIPLPEFADVRLSHWFRKHPEIMEHLEDAIEIAKTLRTYPVPSYIVREQDEKRVREVFDRINHCGKRLGWSSFD